MKPARFHPWLRILHWLMAVLVLAQLLAGLWLTHSVTSERSWLLRLHVTVGLGILILLPIRVLVRLSRPTPSFPTSMPKLEIYAAQAASVALYALMLALPLTGLTLLSYAGYPVVTWFGFHLPSFTDHDLASFSLLRDGHGWLALALVATLFAHVAGVLVHAVVLRDRVLSLMGFEPRGPRGRT
jgi:cytochrome b561